MTIEDVLKLRTDRAIDRAVAEKVMGCVVEFGDDSPHCGCSVNSGDGWPHSDPRPSEGIARSDLARYSTDIAAAWRVVERFRDGYISTLRGGAAGWQAEFHQAAAPDVFSRAKAATMPAAVCYAALLMSPRLAGKTESKTT